VDKTFCLSVPGLEVEDYFCDFETKTGSLKVRLKMVRSHRNLTDDLGKIPSQDQQPIAQLPQGYPFDNQVCAVFN
jgi:hypothetical protein